MSRISNLLYGISYSKHFWDEETNIWMISKLTKDLKQMQEIKLLISMPFLDKQEVTVHDV